MTYGAWRGPAGGLDPADRVRVDAAVEASENLDAALTEVVEALDAATGAAGAATGAAGSAVAAAGLAETAAGTAGQDATAAAQARLAAEQARAEAETYASGAAQSAQFFDTIADGRAAVADGETFGVRAGGSDGLARPTIYRRDGAAAQTMIVTIVDPGDVRKVSHDIGVRAPDIDLISAAIVQRAVSNQGQSADFSGMTQTSTAGSRTMIVRPNLDARYANGGVIDRFEIYLTAPTRISVSSWTADEAGTTYFPHAIQYFDGVAGYNSFTPSVPMPKNGVAAFGADTAVVGVNSSLPLTYVRASTLDFQQFTQTSTANFRFMYSIGVTEPTGILIPQDDLPTVPRALIDKRFTDADGWTLAGASISSGALVSGANAEWTARCQPTDYPYSQLSRRTFSAFADIVSANQVWGVSSIRMNDGHALNAPAAVVDGAAGMLRVYQYDGHTQDTPTTVADEVEIPWTLAGSAVRLDIKRVRFAYTVTLTNRVTGQSVSLTLDYAAGTGADSGRPWGIPCILFPSTTADGVRVTRARYVADYPFPAGSTARVVCIGDSITEASQIGPDYDEGWAYLLEDERAEQGARDTVIAARGGQKSDGAAAAVAEIVRLCGPDTVVVILIGTNDAGIASGSRASWRANVQSMLDQLRTRTQRIALCMLPPGPASAATKRSQINEDILNGYFPGLLPPVRFDLALSLDNDGVTWNPAYRADATHPNVAGNAVMLERLRLDCPEALE